MAAPDPAIAEAFAKWRDEMGLKITCPACGGKDWILHKFVGLPIIAGAEQSAGTVGLPAAPVMPIGCSYCGCMLFFPVTKWGSTQKS